VGLSCRTNGLWGGGRKLRKLKTQRPIYRSIADLWQPADDAFDAIAAFLRRVNIEVDFPKPSMDMNEASSREWCGI